MPGDALRYHHDSVDLSDRNSALTQMVLLAGRDKRVLEVGPATGYVTRVLRERGCRVTGIEKDDVAAQIASTFSDRMIVADVETLDFADAFRREQFDVVMFGDVLEHLVEPWEALAKAARVLKAKGYVVASIPNIAHGSVRLALLGGDFRYTDIGLLDRTHLRFFTRESLEKMFRDAGYAIRVWRRILIDPFTTELHLSAAEYPASVAASLRSDLEAMTYQFVVRAYPVARPRPTRKAVSMSRGAPAVLQTLRELETERQRLEAQARELEAETQRLGAETQRLGAETQRLGAETQRRDAETQRLEAEKRGLERELVQRDTLLAEKDAETQRLEAKKRGLERELVQWDTLLAEKDAEAQRLEAEKQGLERGLVQRDTLLAEKDASLTQRELAIQEVMQQLNAICQKASYRLLERIRRLLGRVAPPGTLRGRMHVGVVGALAFFVDHGFVASVLRLVRVWKWAPKMLRGRSPALPCEPASEAGVAGGAQSVPASPPSTDTNTSVDEQYQRWLEVHGWTPKDERALAEAARALSYRPKVSLLMAVGEADPVDLRATMDAVAAQIYDAWELCIADADGRGAALAAVLKEAAARDDRVRLIPVGDHEGAPADLRAALSAATGEFVGFLESGDELRPDALYRIVGLLNEQRDIDVVYSDEDKRLPDGRLGRPFFKPQWSPDLLLSVDYLTRLAVYRRRLVDEVDGLATDASLSTCYDLALRVTERTGRIAHVALPLYTSRTTVAPSDAREHEAHERGRRALFEALRRRGIEGVVEDTPVPGWYRVRRRIRGNPTVSVIIPTRDKAELLARCLDKLETSRYRSLQIIVVDNGSVEEATHTLLASRRLQVIRVDEPFNFSRLINAGAAAATGDFLLLLNNDVEPINDDWIEALLEHAQREEVGVVGARLLYPDGTPQHEGQAHVTRGGIPCHSVHFDWKGYLGLAHAITNCAAVTGACVMTRRSVFEELGGLDENFRVAFGDTDYCFRAQERGLRVVYTPHAQLYHLEGASRSAVTPREEEELARQRWGNFGDRYYNYALEEVLQPVAVRPTPWESPIVPLEAPAVHDSGRRPFGINVAGFPTSEKGIGESVRAALRCIEAANIPYVLNAEFDGGSANNETTHSRFVNHNPYAFNLLDVNADVMPSFSARKGDGYFRGRYNIGIWAWELNQFPEEWVPHFKYVQEIWAPSRFIADTLSRVSPVPIFCVPHAIDPNAVARTGFDRNHLGFSPDTFLFLFVFDFHSFVQRKNPYGAIAAFRAAFSRDQKVGLIIKSARSDWDSVARRMLHEAAKGANIRIVDTVISREDLNALFRECDCYVSLHRAEGFGITIAEAMWAGKPVIATSYGGNLDFTTPGNSYLVKYKLVEIEKDYGPYKKGWVWAEPDIEQAAELMRCVYANQEQARAVGKRGQEDVVRLLHPKVVGASIRQRLLRVASLRGMSL